MGAALRHARPLPAAYMYFQFHLQAARDLLQLLEAQQGESCFGWSLDWPGFEVVFKELGRDPKSAADEWRMWGGAEKGTVDMLEIVGTSVVVSKGTGSRKAGVLARLFDFDGRGELTADSLVIGMRSCASGLARLHGLRPEDLVGPELDSLALEPFRAYRARQLTRAVVSRWLRECDTTRAAIALRGTSDEETWGRRPERRELSKTREADRKDHERPRTRTGSRSQSASTSRSRSRSAGSKYRPGSFSSVDEAKRKVQEAVKKHKRRLAVASNKSVARKTSGRGNSDGSDEPSAPADAADDVVVVAAAGEPGRDGVVVAAAPQGESDHEQQQIAVLAGDATGTATGTSASMRACNLERAKMLKEVFDSIDLDRSGCISCEELERSLRSNVNFRSGIVTAMFQNLDTDGSGSITFEEILKVLMPSATPSEQRALLELVTQPSVNDWEAVALRDLFETVDSDCCGRAPLEALLAALERASADSPTFRGLLNWRAHRYRPERRVTFHQFLTELLFKSDGPRLAALLRRAPPVRLLTPQQLADVERSFQRYDRAGRGSVPESEFREAIRQFGLSDADTRAIFLVFDHNRDGHVDLGEFKNVVRRFWNARAGEASSHLSFPSLEPHILVGPRGIVHDDGDGDDRERDGGGGAHAVPAVGGFLGTL